MKIYLLLTFIVFNSCMSGKALTETGILEIRFGSGGGFTGEIKTYTLTKDSELFDKGIKLKELNPNTTLNLFKEAQSLKNYFFSESENKYFFIDLKTKEKTNRIVWGYGSTKVDKKVVDFHKALMSIIK